MPAAVTVATVAEPVARRSATATMKPSTRTDILAPSAHFFTASPTPAPIRVCLKPPPAPTISRIAAMGPRLSPSLAVILLPVKPTA